MEFMIAFSISSIYTYFSFALFTPCAMEQQKQLALDTSICAASTVQWIKPCERASIMPLVLGRRHESTSPVCCANMRITLMELFPACEGTSGRKQRKINAEMKKNCSLAFGISIRTQELIRRCRSVLFVCVGGYSIDWNGVPLFLRLFFVRWVHFLLVEFNQTDYQFFVVVACYPLWRRSTMKWKGLNKSSSRKSRQLAAFHIITFDGSVGCRILVWVWMGLKTTDLKYVFIR